MFPSHSAFGRLRWGLFCLHLFHLLIGTVLADSESPSNVKHVIVTYSAGARDAVVGQWESALLPSNINMAHHFEDDQLVVLQGPADSISQAASQLPGVVTVEEDYIVQKYVRHVLCGQPLLPLPFSSY